MHELYGADVDQQGVLKVLGENLYSRPEVALRELVQNAHDSCNRRRIEEGTYEPRIDVIAEPGNATLIIRDNGAGLTHEEVRRYLATIGAGYTRVLRKASEEEGEGDDLIGAFGLGFLSVYVVADHVEVITTSYTSPELTHLFRSKDGLRYTLTEADSKPVGTEVRIKLSTEHESLCNPTYVRHLLEWYCCLLTVPIYAGDQVNPEPPIWRSEEELHPVRQRRLLLETAQRFEFNFEPLCAWMITPSEDLDIRGIVWLQDGGRWASSDSRRVSIFVRGMLVNEDASKALPDWAGFAGAVIECDGLTPTASREDIRRDDVWQRLMLHMRQCLVNGIAKVAQNEHEAWRRVLARHSEALRAATLVEPPLFILLQNQLKIPTSEGDLTLAEVAAATQGNIFLSVGEDTGYEHLIHRALSQPVVDGTKFGVAAFCRQWCEFHGKSMLTLGTESGNREVFHKLRADPDRDARLTALLGSDDMRVVAARFEPETLPVVWIPDREVELKRRLEDDRANKRISSGLLGLARQFTANIKDEAASELFVNMNAPLIQDLLTAPEERANAAGAILRSLAHLNTRRSQNETSLGDALTELSRALRSLLSE